MVNELIPPREDPIDDGFFAGFRGLLSALTYGAPLGEAFQLFVKPGYDRRLKAWFDDLAHAVIDHRRRIDQAEADLQQLQTDERFLSTLFTATRIATATHSPEKLEALRNAVVNVASGIEIDDIQRQIFLRYIDELTEKHLVVLAENRDSVKGWQPAEVSKDVLTGLIWKDLSNRGLFKESAFRIRAQGIDVLSPPITLLGKRFLKLIETPTTDA